jgi:hypothetical protein
MDGYSLGWEGMLDGNGVGTTEGKGDGMDEVDGAWLTVGEKDGGAEKDGSMEGGWEGSKLGAREDVGDKDGSCVVGVPVGWKEVVGEYVVVGRDDIDGCKLSDGEKDGITVLVGESDGL